MQPKPLGLSQMAKELKKAWPIGKSFKYPNEENYGFKQNPALKNDIERRKCDPLAKDQVCTFVTSLQILPT